VIKSCVSMHVSHADYTFTATQVINSSYWIYSRSWSHAQSDKWRTEIPASRGASRCLWKTFLPGWYYCWRKYPPRYFNNVPRAVSSLHVIRVHTTKKKKQIIENFLFKVLHDQISMNLFNYFILVRKFSPCNRQIAMLPHAMWLTCTMMVGIRSIKPLTYFLITLPIVLSHFKYILLI